MNNELFQRARSAYVVKDYENALQQFTDCLQDTSEPMAPGELGLLYHQIGNCLVKLNDPEEAIHAYSQATLDEAYDALGSVSYNLGMVYASQHDYGDAITHFQRPTRRLRVLVILILSWVNPLKLVRHFVMLLLMKVILIQPRHC